MCSKLFKKIGFITLLTVLGVLFPSSIKACTYEATLENNYLNFRITSDQDNIQFVQFMYDHDKSGAPFTVTSLEAPEANWTMYLDGSQTYSGNSMVIQNRKQFADAAYWVSWIDSQHYNLIPSGVYKLGFSGSMSYEDISIEYGSMDSYGNFNISGNDWQFCTRTGDVQFSTPSPYPSPSNTPAPTLTPTPLITSSPTPTVTPTNKPVSKVFLIPGMGASWNVDALINCKNTNYVGDWTLASYAKNYYKEILDQLPAHNWDTYPLYYDWRQDIRSNSSKLAELINTNTTNNEKVNIIGHSMGGLIGRNYLETQQGRKTNKFLAVGAPFQGSPYSYPTFVNGEVWDDDLVNRIAKTLLIKRCGIFPSIQNLLPTYNYLRDIKTNQIKNVSSMQAKNNYLPTNFTYPFWGVKVGTLAGTGVRTIKTINVIKDNNWPDGKPVDKDYTYQGDGTVTISSAQLADALSNQVINQSHSGIISSTEGVSKILEFIGSPGIADPPYIEPKSALVLIGYPGTFWITDKQGKTIQSEQGMISLINPSSSDYQLRIVPQSNSTLFIAAQFLPNGKTLYKEYKFKGMIIEPKIIHFDSEHADEDIIKNTNDYKKPNFPKFWYFFWNFWNKNH